MVSCRFLTFRVLQQCSPRVFVIGDRKNSKFDVHVKCAGHAYGRQTVPDRGVVRSCDSLKKFGAPVISLERLNLNDLSIGTQIDRPGNYQIQ